ncbi:GNAT family N-acetyltransferase [Trinickia dabaoshanensis]|uniref:GNAT family N-acetyltransferase n=1 Tax=Trinickia dabaoshanensis TaxID=564714 RepID=A0A2N7VI86_9BURK|nr:GNAT family N-acetyltransferase [Trinickia dabaoshanensis]PMS16859.1 GNAT family N-acetyltransferase [Trinickia dabaoshanensis]
MEHLTIRRSSDADSEAIAHLYEDAQVYAQTLQLPFPSLASWKKRLSETPTTVYHLVAEIDGELVGSVVVEPLANLRRRHVGTIAIAVSGRRQRQGIGNALLMSVVDLADNWMNLLRLELNVFVDNEPAIALYKKHGFVVEGELAKYAYRNGRYVNVYQMARIKPEGV